MRKLTKVLLSTSLTLGLAETLENKSIDIPSSNYKQHPEQLILKKEELVKSLEPPIDLAEVETWISSRYGRRSGKFHNGIDIAAPRGTPVYPIMAGRVERISFDEFNGWMIELHHGRIKILPESLVDFHSYYAHLNDRPNLRKGDIVLGSDIIAYVGRTGRTFGKNGFHLHLTIKEGNHTINPLKYLTLK